MTNRPYFGLQAIGNYLGRHVSTARLGWEEEWIGTPVYMTGKEMKVLIS